MKKNEFEKIKVLIEDDNLIENFYNKVESQAGIENIEMYLSALAAIVLLCPKFQSIIIKKKRLYEIGKNLFLDSINDNHHISGMRNPLFLGLYMMVLFPKKFGKIFNTRKEYYFEYLADLMLERIEKMSLGAWEIATPMEILMPTIMNSEESKQWIEQEEIESIMKDYIFENETWYGIYALSEVIGLTPGKYSFKIDVPLDWFKRKLEEVEKIIIKESSITNSIKDINWVLWLLFDIKRIINNLSRIHFT